MVQEPLPLFWREARVGTVHALESDMFWWHARWEPRPGPSTEAFFAAVEEGLDPEVLIGDQEPQRFTVTAATPEELELKPRS